MDRTAHIYLGFFVDWALEMLVTIAGYTAMAACESIYIGSFLYISGMVSDMKMRMKSLNPNTSMQPHQPDGVNSRFWSFYLHEIQFHADILWYSEHFSPYLKWSMSGQSLQLTNKLYNFHLDFISSASKSMCATMSMVLFITILTCATNIAFDLYVIDLHDSFNFNLAIAVANMCIITGITFVYCFLSERITTELLAIAEVFYYSAWYQLPVKQQRIVMLPIARSQREFRLTCLGFIDCSLPVFSSVNSFAKRF